MDLEAQVRVLDGKVTEILHLLVGTQLDKKQGFIAEFFREKDANDKLEARITKLEKVKDRAIYIMMGMALPAAYGLSTGFSEILKLFFK